MTGGRSGRFYCVLFEMTGHNEFIVVTKTPDCILFQVDNEYRKVWDKFVLKLDVLDRHPINDSEVLHWVTKFPVSSKTTYM